MLHIWTDRSQWPVRDQSLFKSEEEGVKEKIGDIQFFFRRTWAALKGQKEGCVGGGGSSLIKDLGFSVRVSRPSSSGQCLESKFLRRQSALCIVLRLSLGYVSEKNQH